jgi:hypothetical protein
MGALPGEPAAAKRARKGRRPPRAAAETDDEEEPAVELSSPAQSDEEPEPEPEADAEPEPPAEDSIDSLVLFSARLQENPSLSAQLFATFVHEAIVAHITLDIHEPSIRGSTLCQDRHIQERDIRFHPCEALSAMSTKRDLHQHSGVVRSA